ncbi:helicase-exonuclease AddAB subunit AddA [Priestia megaterium]|nr:helicase-exonuclease AddAB subunit AddA [Priestia megaterium]
MNHDILAKPKGSQWTDDQWKAVVSSGQDILVAAAAGSGKTAVLVERIIKKIVSSEEPIDVDRLLVVTFTNASAAEMRNRIGEALEKELKKEPSSLHLRRQLNLLNRASISTLHSFCLDVIRKYYYMIDLDPGFRIADDTEAELLREEVLEELFEEQYSLKDNELFFDLIDRYTSDRNDEDIQLMVRKLYDFARSNPNPSGWLQMIIDQYDVDEQSTIDSLPFVPFLLEEVKKQLNGTEAILQQALNVTRLPGGPAPRASNIEDDLAQVQRMVMAGDRSFSAVHEQMQQLVFSRLKPCKGDAYDAKLLDEVGELRKKAKTALEKLQSDLFSRPLHGYMADFQKMKPVIETLIFLVKSFGERYEAVKKAKGLVDFSDLEHYCLQILSHKENDQLQPSDVARKYRTQFVEVLVDEYQDTNMVQESLIKLVTKDDKNTGNLFMVGDVKQSIYRFRLAEPFLFLTKYKRFTQDGRTFGMRIDLNKNFRSRTEVLDATNFIFNQLMDEEVGEISYDDAASLKLGASYPKVEGMESELLLISKENEEEVNEEAEPSFIEFSDAELETAQLEARAMARKVKKLVKDRFQVYDRKLDIMRNVTYRDFVILLRSMPWAPQIMEEFKQEGIPIYADLSTGYFDATEVMIMMALLKVIDNPYQDIPLASVLRSPVVGLSDEELATIRVEHKKGTYYEALKTYLSVANEGHVKDKVRHFYDQLKTWRTRARQDSLSALVWQIYRDTGFFEFVGGLPGGKQRQANLRALYDRARQYESTSFRGLFRFLRFIERMQERGNDLGTARALGEQEDVVRLMTIHSSKGLEFPIVFVAGLARQFNLMDLNKSYLLDKELGFGSKYIDPKLRITYPTLLQQTMKRKMKKESMAEEMRVLYVALTRAKEKLILVGTVKDVAEKVRKWSSVLEHKEWVLPSYIRSDAKSYLDWIGPSLIRHHDFQHLLETDDLYPNKEIYENPSRWKLTTLSVTDLAEQSPEEQHHHEELMNALQNKQPVEKSSKYKEMITQRLNWSYSHKVASMHRSKQSVSDMKRQQKFMSEGSSDELIRGFHAPLEDRPKFLQADSFTAAERGTAIHSVMQHLPLHEKQTKKMVQELVDSMVTKELLSKEQAAIVNIADIVAFSHSTIGQQLQQATKVYRELPFSLGVSSKEIYGNWEEEEETILVQGIIDCLYEVDGELILLDFKTDNISDRFNGDFEAAKATLLERYHIQMKLYGKAIEQIINQPLKCRYLYFLDGGYVLEA